MREREGTSLFEATFYDCLMECVGSSCHESAVFVLDEGILTESSAELRAQLLLPQDEWGDNWFSLFPKALRPSDCLLIGGRGAR